MVEHDKLLKHVRSAGEESSTLRAAGPVAAEHKLIEYDPVASAGAQRNKAPNDIDDAPVVRFLHKLLTEAFHRGASDLHFEPFETFYRVRFRVDGVLLEVARPRWTSATRSPPASRCCRAWTSPRNACRRTAA